MNIALLGYGKMGHEIENVALQRGHRIIATIDNEEEWKSKIENLKQCDVAIDFSTPATAVTNMERCFEMGLPVVVGTTGWYDHQEEMIKKCETKNGALFVASNFSIGMNILFALNRKLAQLMNHYDNYNVSMTETHHIHKLDAPSGTAITLAKEIIHDMDRIDNWHLNDGKTNSKRSLPITAIREGEIPGIHEIIYDSDVDTLTIKHSAKSRKGFAIGAVVAAEFLKDKKGYHTMNELIEA